MDPWTPDVELNDDIARRLIERRFPEFGPIELRLFGKGWDNHAYLVNEELVFRMPHRLFAAELIESECAILSGLRMHDLPLPIPAPDFVAAPAEDYPYTIAGYKMIAGTTADRMVWTPAERSKNAAAIGRFLAVLHAVKMSIPNAPGDTIRRADLDFRLPKVLAGLTDEPPEYARLLEDLAKTPQRDESPVWVHGDLYVRHLLVDDQRSVCGVIDWGDSHLGDPALDISIAWTFLPVEAHAAFREAYGGIDEATWRRARFRAMSACMYLRNYARKSGDADLLRECEFMIPNLLAGD